MNGLVAFVCRRPKFVIALGVLLLVLCALPMATIGERVVPGGFEDPNSAALQAKSVLSDELDVPENSIVAVVQSDESIRAAVDKVVGNADNVSNKVAVKSYQNSPGLISGNTALVEIQTSDSSEAATAAAKDVRSQLSQGLSDGESVLTTGAAALNSDYNDQTAKDALVAETIAFPLLILLLLLVFRSVVAMLTPILIGGATLAAASAVGYLVSFFIDISNLYVSAVSIIGLAVAVDYSLFIIRRYLDERDDGVASADAIQTAVTHTGRSVLFGGVIVVVSLAALFVPGVMVLRSIAIAGISATLVAMALSVTMVPAVLTLWGERVFSGNKRLGGRRVSSSSESGWRLKLLRLSPLYGAMVFVLLVVAVSPVVFARLQVPVASIDVVPGSAESRIASEIASKDLRVPSEQPIDVVLKSSDADAVKSVGARLSGIPYVENVVDAGALAGRQAPNGQVVWLQVLPKPGASAEEQHNLVDDLRNVDRPGDVEVLVGGVAAVGFDFDRLVMDSLPLILGIVLVASVVLLWLVSGSALLAVGSVLLNSTVIGAACGLLILIYQVVGGSPVSTMQPILIFAVMFGMSMDYLIVMTGRMREAFRLAPDSDDRRHVLAIEKGALSTAPVITLAGGVMVAVFLSFLAAKIAIVSQLGVGLALAVVIDVLLVRTIVLPALLRIIGPRVWGAKSHDPADRRLRQQI